MSTLKRTKLYDWHKANGGRMVPFAGWEMPVQYPDGPIKEHLATRSAAGLFDIDHMGQIEVKGKDAEKFLNRVVTYDVTRMQINDAHYALFCYEDGGCVDDLFIYKLEDKTSQKQAYYFFLAVNAANLDKDFKWLKYQAADFEVELNNISDDTYMLSIQGPKAVSILDQFTDANLENVPRFTAIQGSLNGSIPTIFGRTGYTGEDGFELFFPADSALDVWEKLLEMGNKDGLKPIGLAARDSLRFEACMPLYGHEISSSITPIEAGLNFAIRYTKEFIGKNALLKQKLETSARVLIGFEMVDKGVPREHYTVYSPEGEEIGFVTSGMFAPSIEKFLGMALVRRSFSKLGNEIFIAIRNKKVKARIVKKPFYVPVYSR